MDLKVFTDGGSINNPGPSASAFVVYQNEKVLYEFSLSIGVRTNNFAEYTGVVKALEWLIKNTPEGVTKINFYSDSNLMINQLNGLFKVKNSTIREFVLKIRSLERDVNVPVLYKHVPREQNQQADSLVKKELFR